MLNDIGIAIRQLRQEGMKEKIAIIDVDFHRTSKFRANLDIG